MSEATSKSFRLARLRFALTSLDPIGLPPFKGSSLRGGFGRIFRRIGCAASALGARQCLLPDRCPYHYVFETPPPAGSHVLERLPAAPHPFVIEPPPETKRRYAPGEAIEFHLTLIGRAIDYLPYFIVAFEELGRHGIGPGNGRYALSGIDGINASGQSTPIYSGGSHRLVSQWPMLHPDDLTLCPDPVPAEATLVFLTPTLVRHANQPGDLTKFHGPLPQSPAPGLASGLLPLRRRVGAGASGALEAGRGDRDYRPHLAMAPVGALLSPPAPARPHGRMGRPRHLPGRPRPLLALAPFR